MEEGEHLSRHLGHQCAYVVAWVEGNVDGGARIVIERNRAHHSNIGMELASEHAGKATSRVTVRSNFIYANQIAWLAMGGYDAARGNAADCAVLNNTFFDNDTDEQGNGEERLDLPDGG